MRSARQILIIGMAFAGGVLTNLPTLSAQDVPYERAMWSTENRYVRAFIAGDIDALDGMWHEDFGYWPAGEDRPWGTRYARKAFNAWSGAESGTLSMPMLEPIAAKIMDDVAVTHYRLEYTITGDDGTKSVRRIRLTHTWIKVGDGWKLLGGSNSAIEG
jgi:ketosteroid isomerase-like protein